MREALSNFPWRRHNRKQPGICDEVFGPKESFVPWGAGSNPASGSNLVYYFETRTSDEVWRNHLVATSPP